jgi:hypothetical protein
MMGPCHLDRNTLSAIREAGFAVRGSGAGMIIWGTARPADSRWTDRGGRSYTPDL